MQFFIGNVGADSECNYYAGRRSEEPAEIKQRERTNGSIASPVFRLYFASLHFLFFFPLLLHSRKRINACSCAINKMQLLRHGWDVGTPWHSGCGWSWLTGLLVDGSCRHVCEQLQDGAPHPLCLNIHFRRCPGCPGYPSCCVCNSSGFGKLSRFGAQLPLSFWLSWLLSLL